MLYKQFSEIADINPDFVSSFDYWLATLPTNRQENITASLVSMRMGVPITLAEKILLFAVEKGILEKYFLVVCPNEDCEMVINKISVDEICDVLEEQQYCPECDEFYQIQYEDIYTAYKVIKKPDVPESEIAKEIEKRLHLGNPINFHKADSIINDRATIYKSFYNPDESAYEEFKSLRKDLDKDYGKNTTAKGNILEVLILKIFDNIRYVKGTNSIKTETNQFDCTFLSPIKTPYLSVYNDLEPYFIIECKNEPDKTPGNTYVNKLIGIMSGNQAKVGILFSRKKAAKTCFQLAHDQYLLTKNTNKPMYILCFDDRDLDLIIDNEVNLLEYLEFKIFCLTSNSPNATWFDRTTSK